MIFAQQHAARAFGALAGLDVSAPERANLLAADVPQHTVDALYPASAFASLLPHLEEHLSQIKPAQIAAPLGKLRERTERLVHCAADVPAIAWQFESDSPHRSALIDFLLDLLVDEELNNFLNYRWFTSHDIKLGEAIWWAHCSMTHRTELPEAGKKAADRLMLTVAKRIGLAY